MSELHGIFDSHAHYFDKRFENSSVDELLKEEFSHSVSQIVNVGTNPETSKLALEQAKKYDGMYAAVGIHPEDCHFIDNLSESIRTLRETIETERIESGGKIVALGEIGLDYHGESFGGVPIDREREKSFLEAQLLLAEELKIPVVIHDREAHGDCFDAILSHKNVTGVFHSYSGSAEMAKDLARRGWYISFSGTLTFKNAPKVREAVLAVPKDRLLVETDCPYLAPHPMRGSLNHSGLISYTLEVLAKLWNCTPQQAADVTRENAKRFFRIP